jgi:hypothetical protein
MAAFIRFRSESQRWTRCVLALLILCLFRSTFFSCRSVRFFLGVPDISFFVSWWSSGIGCYSSQRLCPVFSFFVLGRPLERIRAWLFCAGNNRCYHQLMVDSSPVAADESLVHYLEAELDEEADAGLELGGLGALLIQVLARASEWEGIRLNRSAGSSCSS